MKSYWQIKQEEYVNALIKVLPYLNQLNFKKEGNTLIVTMYGELPNKVSAKWTNEIDKYAGDVSLEVGHELYTPGEADARLDLILNKIASKYNLNYKVEDIYDCNGDEIFKVLAEINLNAKKNAPKKTSTVKFYNTDLFSGDPYFGVAFTYKGNSYKLGANENFVDLQKNNNVYYYYEDYDWGTQEYSKGWSREEAFRELDILIKELGGTPVKGRNPRIKIREIFKLAI